MNFCSMCGSKIAEQAKFCPHCGIKLEDIVTENNESEQLLSDIEKSLLLQEEKSDEKKEKGFKNRWGLIALVTFLTIVCVGSGSYSVWLTLQVIEQEERYEDVILKMKEELENGLGFKQLYFKEPEEAINYFIQCLEEQEFTKMINACAVVDAAENLDFVFWVDSVGGWNINMPIPNCDQYLSLNKSLNYSKYSNSIKWLLLTLANDTLEDISIPVSIENVGEAQALYGNYSSDKVKDFQMLHCEKLNIDEKLKQDDRWESHEKAMRVERRRYGFLDQTEFVTLYKANGQLFIGGFRCEKYEGGWVIGSISSRYGGIPSVGVKLGSEDEYNEIIEKWR